jgi:hypothetical protein
MGQVAAGLEVLLAMKCSTPTCEGYKLDLIESALKNYATLSEIAGEWSPTFERLGLLSGAGRATGEQGLRPRPAGTPLSVGAAQVEKAVAYFASVKGGPKGVGGTVDRGTTGIEWGKGIQGQGMPWENYLSSQLPAGSRLPPNFKTFDFYDEATKTAISAKTLDTTTLAKVANPSQVYSSLKSNIDATVKFTEYSLGRTTLSSSQITARELQVAIPKGTTTAQWEQIKRAVQYGQGKGVTVKITTVD